GATPAGASVMCASCVLLMGALMNASLGQEAGGAFLRTSKRPGRGDSSCARSIAHWSVVLCKNNAAKSMEESSPRLRRGRRRDATTSQQTLRRHASKGTAGPRAAQAILSGHVYGKRP